jgi:hypothetical protein
MKDTKRSKTAGKSGARQTDAAEGDRNPVEESLRAHETQGTSQGKAKAKKSGAKPRTRTAGGR